VKVLLTHNLFPPDFAGGGEYVVLATARTLLRRGIDVRVLTTGNASIVDYEGIPTRRLPIHRYAFNLAVPIIARHARDVDVIHTFTYHACLPSLVAGRLTGKPVVCLVLGLFGNVWRDTHGHLGGRIRARWERFLLTRGFDKLIFISTFSRNEGLRLGVPIDRTAINVPGIDLDRYSPARSKDDVVLFSGKLDTRKGIDDVIAVARALPDVRFRIMGWGDRERELRSQSPSNVEWRPYPSQGPQGAGLCEEFARARVFFFPSKGETFGIALVEAMASGCAIVSSVPLEFEGARVEPGDREAMIRAIRRLWDDRDASLAVGLANCQRAQQYTWDRHVDQLEAIYREVSAEPPARTQQSAASSVE
jgi:glycosyltransferase involved in cell wall biosynthesis